MRVSVFTSPQLQAVLVKLRTLDKDTLKVIRATTRQDVLPIWREQVSMHVQTRAEGLVLGKTARVAVSNQTVTLQSARVGRKLRGGLDPKTEYAAVEFGAEDRGAFRGYQATNRQGTTFNVKRRTKMQLRQRKATGHVVYPAVAETVPRVISLWVQDVMHVLGVALNG